MGKILWKHWWHCIFNGVSLSFLKPSAPSLELVRHACWQEARRSIRFLKLTSPERPSKQVSFISAVRWKTPVINKTIIPFIPSGSRALIIHVKRQLDIPPQNSRWLTRYSRLFKIHPANEPETDLWHVPVPVHARACVSPLQDPGRRMQKISESLASAQLTVK